MNVYEAIKNRRTVRIFNQESIDRDCIIKMIDSARLSPSAGNVQSLKYAIIDSLEDRKAIFSYIKYAAYIDDWNPTFSESPASFIAVLNDTTIRKTNALSECDCGIAMMSISLMAVEMGFDSCILGSIDRHNISKVLNIRPEYDIMYLIGIGKSKQKNKQYDADDSIKYVMDTYHNFKVPKRKLESIIVDR